MQAQEAEEQENAAVEQSEEQQSQEQPPAEGEEVAGPLGEQEGEVVAEQQEAPEPSGEAGEGGVEAAAAEGGEPVDGAEAAEGEQQIPAEGEDQPEGDAPPAGEEGGEEAGKDGEPAEAAPEEVAEEVAPAEEEPPPPVILKDLGPPSEGDLPLPYALNEEGKPIPLPGVESIFCTASTLEILGLTALGTTVPGEYGPEVVKQLPVSKEVLLHDIQFRGAISDLAIIKQKIIDADYDPVVLRLNADDVYGDGNNIEVVCVKAAIEVWEAIDLEILKRRLWAATADQRMAAEKAAARVAKKLRLQNPEPWTSLGSEFEIDEISVRPRRELIKIEAQRRRAEFSQAFKLSDKDAHELWNSSQMECRPFKDPNFELKRVEVDMGVQAVAPLIERAIQATGLPYRTNSTQYDPRDLPPDAKRKLLMDKSMAAFLDKVKPLCEEALVQNEVTNIFEDDFQALSEEDGVSGNRKENVVTEFQSFTHLTYSKNKVVSAIQWLPHRKGVIAVACTEHLSHAERVARAGRPSNAYILIWNFKDPIHPEYVLESPFEVFSFQYNPTNPDIIAAGCYNGQIVIWDTSHDYERLVRSKHNRHEEAASDETSIPVVKYRFFSAVDFSHHTVVTDLQWLPALEFRSGGRVQRQQEGVSDCNFFASCAADGRVNFWDIRVEKLMKKGRRDDDLLQLVWKPTHSVPLLSLAGMDLGGAKICFNFTSLDSGQFYVGSTDGELVYADFVKPEGVENPDYCKFCLPAHAGSVVAIERSPFFDDIILSVGDWSFQVWQEGQQTPLFQSGYGVDYYTAGCWSPTRPAVLYLTDESGNLEIWDMLDRSHEPSIKVTLASSPLMSLSFISGASAAPMPGQPVASQPQFLALGDSSGVLHIMEMPRNLRRPVPNEKKLMTQFLQREMERVKDVAARAPIRSETLKLVQEVLKEKDSSGMQGEEGALRETGGRETGGPARSGMSMFSTNPMSGIDEKAEAEYYKMEHEFKIQLGLIDEEEQGLSSSKSRSNLD